MLTNSELALMQSSLGKKWNADEWYKAQKMRARIPAILDLVKDLWSAHPEQRLFQLLMNIMNYHGDPFGVEDDSLKERLEHALEQHKREKVREVSDSES